MYMGNSILWVVHTIHMQWYIIAGFYNDHTVQTGDKVNACCICVCQKNAFTCIITTTNAHTRTVYASASNVFFHTYT